MIMTALVLMASASLFTASAADKNKNKGKKVEAPVTLTSSSDSLSYAAGMNATRGLTTFIEQSYQVQPANMADFIRGYKDALSKGITPELNAYAVGMQIANMVSQRIIPATREELKSASDSIDNNKFQQGFIAALANDTTYFTAKAAQDYQMEVLTGAGERFLKDNAYKPGVKVLPSGLQYKVITEGHGEVPKASDEVEVIYEGRLIDGTVFDSTAKHGSKTDKFIAGKLIKGWTEALTMMPVGSKWEIYIPQELGYGARQAGMIPPYSTLVFNLELVSIVKPEVKEPVEEEVKADTDKKTETVKKSVKTVTPAKKKSKK